jgi:hypothetical protein
MAAGRCIAPYEPLSRKVSCERLRMTAAAANPGWRVDLFGLFRRCIATVAGGKVDELRGKRQADNDVWRERVLRSRWRRQIQPWSP